MTAPAPVALPARRPSSPWQRARLGVEIVTTYARVRWDLRRSGLERALSRARSNAPAEPAVPDCDATQLGLRLGRAVVRTLSPLPADSRCLMRSLVLGSLLARRGIDSKLVLGVHPGETFAAHAWVEREGRALLDPGGSEFERLTEM